MRIFFAKFNFSEAGGDDDEDESYVHPFQPPKGKNGKPTHFSLLTVFGTYIKTNNFRRFWYFYEMVYFLASSFPHVHHNSKLQ